MVEELQHPQRLQLMRGVLVAAAALVFAATPGRADQVPAASPHDVAEPSGLYQGVPHGYTPATLAGGTVLDSAALETMVRDQHPILIDVADKDREPPSMAKGMLWRPQHRSIVGSVWLPGAGSGTADAAFADAFRTRLARLAGDDPARPIVVFCHPDCWASYNAAKRLVGLGYRNVGWYPQGLEGWQDAHATAIVEPDAAWLTSLPKALTE